MPEISIIIPVYNATQFLSRTLESIQRQTFEDWECVLMDDGSTDTSTSIAEQFVSMDGRFRLFHRTNGGICNARNSAFRQSNAHAPFALFTDHDDVLHPCALELLREALIANPDAVAAHGIAEMIDETGVLVENGWFAEAQAHRFIMTGSANGTNLAPLDVNAQTTFNAVISNFMMHPPGKVLVRRSAINALRTTELFDPATMLSEDWDFWIRVSRQGKFCFVPEVVVSYRLHNGNASRTRKQQKIIWNVRLKALCAPENTDEQRKLLLANWEHVHWGIIREHLNRARSAMRNMDIIGGCWAIGKVPFVFARMIWFSNRLG